MSQFSFFLAHTGQIFLLSNDKDFLYDKAKVIAKYSESTYPSQHSPEIIVDEFDSAKQQSYYLGFIKDMDGDKSILNQGYMRHCKEVFSEGYKYALKVDNLFPDYINKIIFALNFFNSFNLPGRVTWNCHGLALLISGAFPTPIHSYQLESEFFGLQQITLDELRPGDIVNFGKYDHSIIYLDKDICFSCNGVRAPLEIHSLELVLKTYKVNSLDNSEIICYRKPTTLLFSDKLIRLISIQANLYTEMIKFQLINSSVNEKLIKKYHDELSVVMTGIYAECYRDYSESNINIRHLFFLQQINWCFKDAGVDIFNNMYRLANAQHMQLISYQDSINALNKSSEELDSYTTALEKQLVLERNTKDKLARPFKQFLEELWKELEKIKSANSSKVQYLDSVYNKMNTIFGFYLSQKISTRVFSTQIHHAIHNDNGGFRSILQCYGSCYLWSLLDNILWLIDPYRWVTGERLSFFKFAQPISLTIMENIEQCLGENLQKYDPQFQDLSAINSPKKPEALPDALNNFVEIHDSQFIQILNITFRQVSTYVLIAVLAIIFYQPFQDYESSCKQMR